MRILKQFGYFFFVIMVGCEQYPILSYSPTQSDTCITVNNRGRNPDGFGLEILENSLDDTIIIRSIKVAPKMIGEMFYIRDFYRDTANICIQKNNAAKGVIKIKYFF